MSDSLSQMTGVRMRTPLTALTYVHTHPKSFQNFDQHLGSGDGASVAVISVHLECVAYKVSHVPLRVHLLSPRELVHVDLDGQPLSAPPSDFMGNHAASELKSIERASTLVLGILTTHGRCAIASVQSHVWAHTWNTLVFRRPPTRRDDGPPRSPIAEVPEPYLNDPDDHKMTTHSPFLCSRFPREKLKRLSSIFPTKLDVDAEEHTWSAAAYMHQTQRNAHRRVLKRDADLPKRGTLRLHCFSLAARTRHPRRPRELTTHRIGHNLSGVARVGEAKIVSTIGPDLASTPAHRLFNLCCVGKSHLTLKSTATLLTACQGRRRASKPLMPIEDDGDNNGNVDGGGRFAFSRVGYQNSGCQRRVGGAYGRHIACHLNSQGVTRPSTRKGL
ncbi:hypothetical protein HETIRDRAFT_428912 [Heterobasidion irregulare TC 32-1]|uniref:Uncharacterized protein n=1 Tax=Heterobasidion irregulare (strain TC 32-1) TaxID=747525 RepID=W4K2P2_HETIT|nr:uncharacterized protein HETIRDRAFT_428912 [Heterobasidion irregulare TC 32-1]ETW79321.1 hypothetical protein HETIRDRAFT_428912 [Heterobasidion irregulare TC 32-1]